MRLEKHDCAGEDMCTLPREPADFETVHVKELQFLQMSSSKADIHVHYSFSTVTCPYYCHSCSAHLNALKCICKIHGVAEVGTNVLS